MSFMDLVDIAFGALDAHLRPQSLLAFGSGGAAMPPVAPIGPEDQARRRVRHLKFLFLHLASFGFLSLLFLIINLLTGRAFYWAPIAIWALAMPLALHTMLVHRWRGLFGALAVPLAVLNIGLVGLNIFVSARGPWSLWTLSVSAIPVIGMGLVSFGITTPARTRAISGGLVVALLGVVGIFDHSVIPTAIFNAAIVVSLLIAAQQLRLGRWSLCQAHLALFVAINAEIFTLNIVTEPDTFWFQFVLAASVLLLAVHAMVRYGLLAFYDASWEQAKIAQLTARIQESAVNDAVQRNIYRTARIQRSFWMHLFFYLVAALDLTVLNLLSGTGTPWMLWPVGVWGVAILTHFGYAFGPNRRLSANAMFWLDGAVRIAGAAACAIRGLAFAFMPPPSSLRRRRTRGTSPPGMAVRCRDWRSRAAPAI